MFRTFFVPGTFWNKMFGVLYIHVHETAYGTEDSLKIANKSGRNVSPN